MNLRSRRQEDPEISLTALIDVVFTILIFFVVSTTFVHEGNLQITLPESSTTPAVESPDKLELTIDAEGKYYVNGRLLANRQADTLRRALERAVEGGADRAVVIRADAKTQHQAVVTALDAVGQAGIKRVAIATLPEGETP